MKTKNIYYCIEKECNKEICYNNFKNGKGRCYSCANIYRWSDLIYKGRVGRLISKSLKNKYKNNPKCKEIIFASRKNKEYLENMKQKCIKLWDDEEYINKVREGRKKGLNQKPNKPEQLLIDILNKYLPNEYKYVGNGKFFIERFNPDFININGQKKIIEMFGCYWHGGDKARINDAKRIYTYRKKGYKTLIIWEYILKVCSNKEIGAMIKKFNEVKKV